ncbi:DinB family protein [Streptomonospora algeriensis]|uniref:DinB family protein n=1 Tax=Streptomonospora algeriensis TaxID=995084 RepID=A0ABW3BKR5_9ACTN
MAAPAWGAQILGQLAFHWENVMRPRLRGLDDDEYFWEPVEGCWSVRPRPHGTFAIDSARPEPDPPPVTTIAWRLSHIIVPVLEIRIDHHFGDRTMSLDNAVWPGSAAAALDRLERAYRRWCGEVAELGDAELAAPVGDAEPPQWSQHSFATLALHVNREIIHHHAEVALLRDLYRSHPAHRGDAV